jgi:lipopolysaccharide transport system ATP-binding protein
MSEIVIRAEHISKLYRLGSIGSGSITGDFSRWIARIRGKEDPSAKIYRLSQPQGVQNSDSKNEFWALRDVNFEIKAGEAIGIIGNNGAGKSTMLKILSRVTMPTTGAVKIKGRIASLLEVGTGFHPDLTGRENVFLNGAIMGMSKTEIRQKFDEIVEFSGVKQFIDTPVKRYSSGMYVRLAFAVAAHLEPEILIIDEVLAVGDAEFQKKCLGKMGEVAGQGRTVLFVSHHMAAVKAFCSRGILMEKGTVKFAGDVSEAIDQYLSYKGNTDVQLALADRKRESHHTLEAKIIDMQVLADGSINPELIDATKSFTVSITIDCFTEGLRIAPMVIIADEMQNLVYCDAGSVQGIVYRLSKGKTQIKCVIGPTFLARGNYHIDLQLDVPRQVCVDRIVEAYTFSVPFMDPYNTGFNLDRSESKGVFHVQHQWSEADFIG